MNKDGSKIFHAFKVIYLYDDVVCINKGSLYFHSDFGNISNSGDRVEFEPKKITVSDGDSIYLKVVHSSRDGSLTFCSYESSEITTEFEESDTITSIEIARLSRLGNLLSVDQKVHSDVHITIPGTKSE